MTGGLAFLGDLVVLLLLARAYDYAQGTEAQRAATVEQGVVHDGPVRDSECAQTLSGGGK